MDSVLKFAAATSAFAFLAVSGPAPSPAPTDSVHDDHTTPPLGGWIPSPTLNGAPDLLATFPARDGLLPAWGTGAVPGLYGAGEGAFRFTCGGEGDLRYDDPLLYPGQPGKSHLHKFFGANGVTSATTSETLAAGTSSNCNYGTKVLNRSAYWMPALIVGTSVVNPDWIAVYYKRPMASSARCTPGSSTFQGPCVGLPNRIRFISGWDATKPDRPGDGASWYCTAGAGGHYRSLDAVFASGCVAGSTLVADITFPNCWDGKNLDSPDHRSHMAWASYGDWGYLKCPATHPYVIPQTENKYAFTVTADMIGHASLSSDAMKPGAKPGETMHGDYMEAWVGEAKRMWLDGCINKGLNCSGGDLGNGLQLPGAAQPSYGWVNPIARTPIPAKPGA